MRFEATKKSVHAKRKPDESMAVGRADEREGMSEAKTKLPPQPTKQKTPLGVFFFVLYGLQGFEATNKSVHAKRKPDESMAVAKGEETHSNERSEDKTSPATSKIKAFTIL